MTENEDACRDLSGRRLRLVNADKKLQDWAAAEKQRKDEKQAAKEERDRVKADNRAEDTQVGLPARRAFFIYAIYLICPVKHTLLLHQSKVKSIILSTHPPVF